MTDPVTPQPPDDDAPQNTPDADTPQPDDPELQPDLPDPDSDEWQHQLAEGDR